MPSLDTKLADGRTSTIVQLPDWTESALICWGGLRLGGQTTVHLVSQLVDYCGQLGGLAACMPNWGANVIWTFEFGYKGWTGALLCKNCFEIHTPGGARSGPGVVYSPKKKKMPVGGWFTYGVKPLIEQNEDKKAAAVVALLSVPPPKEVLKLRELAPDGSDKRIVEV
jgi:hypothetical protein